MIQSTAPAGPLAAQGCVGTDPLEATTVRAGWLLVDAHERLGSQQARQAFRPWLDAWLEHARATLADLQPWREGLATFKVNESDTNRLRHRRTLDVIFDGETVFDVGSGKGYLCGLLLRDRAVAAYHGIDIVKWHHKQVAKVLEANQLPGDNVHVRFGDLYELQRETVEASGATVVTCCEVLEHVPDAAEAVKVLTRALPDKADLVFSVPLYGRIENVWGHSTTFDSTRLKLICAEAGLYVHHVEPVANTWTLVVASRRPEASDRVRHALSAIPSLSPSVPLARAYDFRSVQQAEISARQGPWTPRSEVSPAHKGNVRCDVPRDRLAVFRSAGRPAGVTFPVEGLTALRLRLDLPDRAPVSSVVVAAYAADQLVGRWAWQPRRSQLAHAKTHRWAFRFGSGPAHFDYHGAAATTMADVSNVDVLVRTRSGKPVSFTLGAAYVPAHSNEDIQADQPASG